MRRVTAKCPGSCGELIQGWVGDSQKLVSYGINSFSWATIAEGSQKLKTADKKAWLALQKSLHKLNLPAAEAENLSLHIYSELPIAKGMASSTADIAATCLAVAEYYQRELAIEDIIEICLEIERTDSTLFSSLTLFEQEFGKVRESSGWRPNFYVLVLEPEERIATDTFHSQATSQLFYQQRYQFRAVYEKYLAAVEEKSIQKLGTAASESATLNQGILAKPFFEELLMIKEHFQLMGINVAHSGSVVGLMIAEKEQIQPVLREIENSPIRDFYTKIKVHRSCYQGVQLA
ncbi:L-threonine kinase [Enterococcus sp. PF1-24]|uniref:GHMP family kinase ATP-binding protein n=1 Tax=unclassified Enterococcus TaxID=2608891 RepID=UPI002474B14E|nr:MULTISPECIES: hypothetical protein [unclassified Enterococcus]MDH6363390.1 L-threonine kinase [Enterococcus sp. PFB1-1]MDH6400309.1 L-threonine kinase [Enterococcus sp. PF1-24]